MFIYVDESGTFVRSDDVGSWNIVGAFVVPEPDRKRVELILRDLKVALGRRCSDEIKLRDISEQRLKAFLAKLIPLQSTLFVTGIDLGKENSGDIARHQAIQVEKIRENRPKMLYEGGRELVEDLASRLEHLSPQLYTQLVVQTDLLDQVLRSTTLYYSQRIPATLAAFRWRIDEKNSARPLFEEAIRYLAPGLLQAKSVREPGIFVEGFDYSHFDRSFKYAANEFPQYLQDETGIAIKSGTNLGKIFSDLRFVRSHDVVGVQVADLLSSAFRRVLRAGFSDNSGIARLLGALTVQRAKPDPSIHLITMSGEGTESGHAYDVARATTNAARPMLAL
jgi:hypothetical protein